MEITNFFPEFEEDENRLNDQILQLGLKVNLSQQEMALDRKEIDILLNHILSYPSTPQAELHRESNRLGKLDFDKQEKYRKISELVLVIAIRMIQQQPTKICSCCGFILQQHDLEVCAHDIKDINNLGISTYVYFKTIFNVAILLAIMFFVYSIYSIATNIKASEMKTDGRMSSDALKFLSISLGSKELYSSDQKQMMYVIGAWIGCAMLLIWGVIFMGLKYYQKQDEVKILMQTKTASEYSLVIQKMPTGLSLEQVQQQLNKYFARLKQTEQISIEELRIEKYNEGKPFYFNQEQFNNQELKEVMEMNQIYKSTFVSWILQRRWRDTFSRNQKFRNRKYKQYERIMAKKHNICESIINKIKEEYKKKNKESKTTVFVTFTSNKQKNLILDYNPQDLISRFKDFIPFLRSKNRFSIERNGVTYNLKIFPAPDPEDVVWSNIGVTTCQIIARKFLTFTITTIILAISFVIVYSLANTQAQNQISFYLSVLISLSISIINLIIIQVIQLLTKYERDYTMTNYQTSLAIKSIVAQTLNTIFVPFMAAYFIKKNIYGPGGLIEDVFILAITNSFVAPLFKIIDPYYYLRLLYSKFKLQPKQKLWTHQFQLNEICERVQFQVGYEYIYIVNLFIFTCYYVSLQPIIPVFAILGLLCMHWAQKYSLYKRCQRPVPGTKILNTAMSQMIYFGTIAYSLGSLTWANFLPQNRTFEQSVLPNFLSMSVALLIFVIPYEVIFRKIFKNKRMPQVFYTANRIFFTSEYDRLNPSTSEAGIKQYRQFLQSKRKELEQERPQVKSRISMELELNNRPNFFKQSSNGLFTSFKNKGNEAVYNNLINRQAQNILTPQMIANVIMPNRLSLSRTNFVKHLPVLKLNKIRTSLPRRRWAVDAETQMKKQEEERNYNMARVQSIKFDNGIEEMAHGLKESKVQNYFNNITHVQSYIMAHEEQKPKNGQKIAKASKLPVQIQIKTRKKSKENILPYKQKQFHQQNSNISIAASKKANFRSSMIKQMSASMKCDEEVPNRFSINAENIIPLCIDDKEQINFGESLIKFYELGDFQ